MYGTIFQINYLLELSIFEIFITFLSQPIIFGYDINLFKYYIGQNSVQNRFGC